MGDWLELDATMDTKTMTPHELEILRLVAEGLRDKDIAAKLGASHGSIRTYLSAIYAKLSVHSRVKAVNAARENGLL